MQSSALERRGNEARLLQRSMASSKGGTKVGMLLEEMGGACSFKDKRVLLVVGEETSLPPPSTAIIKAGMHALCLRGSQPTHGRQSIRNSLMLPDDSRV
jgi:hypothetical protein|eukprot:evm.model.NODE_25632_length_3927_cov_15.870130.2